MSTWIQPIFVGMELSPAVITRNISFVLVLSERKTDIEAVRDAVSSHNTNERRVE